MKKMGKDTDFLLLMRKAHGLPFFQGIIRKDATTSD